MLFIAVAIVGVLVASTLTVYANPSQITETPSASATTTVTYMSAGTATTTLVLDAQVDGGAAVDSAAFEVQFIGSSTASNLNVSFEYAQSNTLDCKTNQGLCNWYIDSLTGSTTRAGLFAYASSTPGGGLIASSSPTTRIFTVPTPTRFVRAVITQPAGSLPGSVWTSWVSKREQR